MNKTEENKLSMYNAVIDLLEDSQAITATRAAFAPAETDFKTAVGNIKAKNRELGDSTAGVTSSKYSAESELVEAVYTTASALSVYAKRQKNAELMALTDISKSTLKKMRDTELVSKAKSISGIADASIADLADYGITAGSVTDLNSKLSAFENSIGDQSSGFASKSAARKSLNTLFAEADDILKKEVDKMIDLFKENYSDFYNKYQAARVIKDLGKRGDNENPDNPESPDNPSQPS